MSICRTDSLIFRSIDQKDGDVVKEMKAILEEINGAKEKPAAPVKGKRSITPEGRYVLALK